MLSPNDYLSNFLRFACAEARNVRNVRYRIP
jgi:hypothetical protein